MPTTILRKSRPLARLCACGQPTVQYVTAKGIAVADECSACAEERRRARACS